MAGRGPKSRGGAQPAGSSAERLGKTAADIARGAAQGDASARARRAQDLPGGSLPGAGSDVGALSEEGRAAAGGRVAELPRRGHADGQSGDYTVEQQEGDEAGGDTDVVLSVPLSRERGTLAEDDTPPVAEHNLELAEDGSGMRFDRSSVLAFPNAGNLRGEAGTVMLDITPDWHGGEDGDYSLVTVRNANDPANLLRVFKNGTYLRFILADGSGEEREVGMNIAEWQPGERHSVAVTWGDAATAMYVDDQVVGQNTYTGNVEFPSGTPLYLGSDVPEAGLKGAGGIISNFRAFGRVLTPEEIAGVPAK
ncbi:MAG: LamG domain-containing protein [Candidatus Binatia bacterium]